MVQIVLILSYLVMAFCLVILLVPKILRRVIDFFSLGSRLYLVGLLRLVWGAMLLSVACQTRLWGYTTMFGLLLAGTGLAIFFLALRRTKKLLNRLQKQSNLILRLYALLGLAIWAILVYSLLQAIPPAFPR